MWPFDQNNPAMYQQYAQAYNTGNYNGFDPNMAMGNVQQFMQNAPWDVQQNVFQQHFAQMPYDQRVAFAQQAPPQYGMDPNNPTAMAQGFMNLGREQPGFLANVFRHPLLLGGGVALAGVIAKHMIDRHERREAEYGGPPMGGQSQYGGNPNEWRDERQEARREERQAEREFERAEQNPNPWAASRERQEAEREMREGRREMRESERERREGW